MKQGHSEQSLSTTFRTKSIQDKARFLVWLYERGNPQVCNFQGSLNHEG